MIGAYFQCGGNELNVEEAIKSFRSFYPNEPVVLVNDGSSVDYSKFCCEKNILYRFEQKNQNASTTSIYPNGSESACIFLKRFYDGLQYCYKNGAEFVVLLEDDVRVLKKQQARPLFSISGCNKSVKQNKLLLDCLRKSGVPEEKIPGFYGGCGGCLFETKFWCGLHYVDLEQAVIRIYQENPKEIMGYDQLFSYLAILFQGTIGENPEFAECTDNNVVERIGANEVSFLHQYKFHYSKTKKMLGMKFDVEKFEPRIWTDTKRKRLRQEKSRSWDLFDTLVAGLDPRVPAGDQLHKLFPVYETVSQVKDGDFIISDYYSEAGAISVVRNVVGKKNEVTTLVSPDGKSSGSIWPVVSETIECHTGDNYHSDVKMAQLHGIKAIHFTSTQMTNAENFMFGICPQVAMTMRKARLTSQTSSDLEIEAITKVQIQMNFPASILFSYLLVKFMQQQEKRVALMSARDCFLWVDSVNFMLSALGHSGVAMYTPAGRTVFLNPSQTYQENMKRLLQKDTVIVDGYGTGNSPTTFLQQIGKTDVPIVMIVRYRVADEKGCRVYPMIDMLINDGFEAVNYANHCKYCDWDRYHESTQLINPSADKRLEHGHRVFRNCMSLLKSEFTTLDFVDEQKIKDGFITVMKDMQNEKLVGKSYGFTREFQNEEEKIGIE